MSDNKKKSIGGGSSMRALKGDNDLSSMVYGKVQPQAIPLEEVVLGAIMLDQDALNLVMDILQEESFYVPGHQKIYAAMKSLFEKSSNIDLLTVNEQLTKDGVISEVGGAQYLVKLTNKVGSAANIEYHARIIAQKHILRELIRVSTNTINGSFDETKDVFELLDESEKNLFDITQKNLNRGFESLSSLAIRAQKKLEEISQKEEGLTGVPTGFFELDKLTSGWQASDLIIVAARPGMGKTSFTLSIAKNAAMAYKFPVAFFSLEMSNLQLAQRLLSMESGVSSGKMRNGSLSDAEWTRFHTAVERMAEVPIYIDDTPGINIFELRAKCRRLKMQHDIKLVVIDYLQLMSGGSDSKKMGNREQEISSISRALKGMAKELDIPVIALSQLSRSVESRSGEKRPQLSDLRESGAIEQDADIVSFIYRPEYYGIEQDEGGNSLKGIAEIIVAKHRNGALENVKLKFIHEFAKFDNLESYDLDLLRDELGSDDFETRDSRMNSLDEDVPF